MKKGFLISLVGGLIPIVVFTTIAMMQLGKFTYTKLGGVVIRIQAGYVILLLLATIFLFVFKKNTIALGLLVSFILGSFVSIFIFLMGT